MANVQNIAEAPGALLTVRVSRMAYEIIQRSDDRRTVGVQAVMPLRGTSVEITVSLSCAEEFKEWANDAWQSAERGQRKSLNALRTALHLAMREYRIRDSVPDPGKEAILMARNGGARLSIGEVVVDVNNDLVQIVSGPDFYKVTSAQGMYANPDGSRFDWRYGYCASLCKEGGLVASRHFFNAPHNLWSKDDGKITHLKLVYNANSLNP